MKVKHYYDDCRDHCILALTLAELTYIQDNHPLTFVFLPPRVLNERELLLYEKQLRKIALTLFRKLRKTGQYDSIMKRAFFYFWRRRYHLAFVLITNLLLQLR